MQELVQQIHDIAMVFGIAFFMVLVAMSIDLVLGLRKAKQRGEYRSSTGLRKTITKLLIYGGALVMVFFADVLLNWSGLYSIFHWNVMESKPIVTCLATIFILAIELKSIFEKADAKIKKEANDTAAMIAAILKDKNAVNILKAALDKNENTIES